MNFLFVIPARGGSKGIPKKNIKLLNGKALILYALENALKLTTADNICVSTDDTEINATQAGATVLKQGGNGFCRAKHKSIHYFYF